MNISKKLVPKPMERHK